MYKNGYQVNPDINFLQPQCHLTKKMKDAGLDTSYRCVEHRNCSNCKKGPYIQDVSFKEEAEQNLIDKSLFVDLEAKQIVAKLPFIEDPSVKLAPNKDKAMATYRSQVRKLNKHPEDKLAVIKSEAKLQELGYVDYLKNLTPDQQKKLSDSKFKNFIPWRIMWKSSSLSTPVRMVMDATLPTSTGYAINDILAKGINNMNSLLEIILRWFTQVVVFHTDVSKMYNTIRLHEEHWCFQRYFWQANLDLSEVAEEKIIKTIFYGLRPSGNQAECGLRLTAKLSKDQYPEVCEIIHRDVYVDDCLSGANTTKDAHRIADEMTVVLSKTGFNLKGFIFSGEDIPEHLTEDGESVVIGGSRYFPKTDEIQLNIGELNFSTKQRGRKSTENINKIPEKLTRRHCVAKVSEVFDLAGRVTPIVARFKLDLRVLVQRRLDWDDVLPDELRALWIDNFEMIQELRNLRFKRCVIPEDAARLEVSTIDMSDATCSIAVVAIYARILRKNGEYSCQLVFGRSKILTDGTTQPRAELIAARLNAQSGYVIKRSFGERFGGCIKMCDSQVALCWMNNSERPLNVGVRSQVTEIRRLSNISDWRYLSSLEMLADIGTRRDVNVQDVAPGSLWVEGHDWMRKSVDEFPVKKIEELSLDEQQLVEYRKGIPKEFWQQQSEKGENHNSAYFSFPSQKDLEERYKFSKYIIDPNKHCFSSVLRIFAIVRRFVKAFIKKYSKESKKVRFHSDTVTDDSTVDESDVDNDVDESAHVDDSSSVETKRMVILSDDEITHARKYFFSKATEEVKHFVGENKVKKISKEVDGILYFTGRILPTQEYVVTTPMTDVMTDLTSTSFCVPLVDKCSPLAFSIINDVHWNHDVANHSGVETVLRYTMKVAYIIEGRDLVAFIRKRCERCRFLLKRTVEVAMGPISRHNLTIAPAFYITQLDIAGPFKAYTPHNKRATIKAYLVVFCCATTSTVNIKAMDDYSTPSFIQAYIRLSSDVGYPKTLLPDEGSQLVKGCENMNLNFADLKYQLHLHENCDFRPCPVGGHNVHGRVERKIQDIKKSIEKTVSNQRLSILEWETLGSEIANTINDLPIGLGSKVANLESLDLLTPNRLKLGRNNNRSPVGPLELSCDLNKFLTMNQQIYDTWFECWLVSYVPTLVDQPKWFKKDRDIKEGDVIIFPKEEKVISGRYQYGMIDSVEHGPDNLVRAVQVRYRNSNETTDRITRRSVRNIVVIHMVDELDLHKVMYDASLAVDCHLVQTL